MPILLVEHYLPLAQALRRGLEEEGIVTHVARDEVEAYARAHAAPYAAALVDWRVPRKGGAALVRLWRHEGLTLPVVLLVPSAADADCQAATAAGADAALPLPFAFADLLALLSDWVGPTGVVGRPCGRGER
jgi:two-component system response regulator BasR